jgi:hypothetical protein
MEWPALLFPNESGYAFGRKGGEEGISKDAAPGPEATPSKEVREKYANTLPSRMPQERFGTPQCSEYLPSLPNA